MPKIVISFITSLFLCSSAHAQKVDDGSERNLTTSQRTELRSILEKVLPAPKETHLFGLKRSNLNAYCGYMKLPKPNGELGRMLPFYVHPKLGRFFIARDGEYFYLDLQSYVDFCPSS